MQGLRALILRNLTLQGIGEAVALACGLLGTILLSRYLDVAGFGAFNYVFAFLYLFLSLNDLGVNTVVVREVSQAPARAGEIIGAATALRLVMASAVLVSAWIAIWLWPMDPSLRWPLSLFALILPLNALNVPVVIFQTSMRFEYTAVTTIIWRVSGLLLIAAALLAGFGLMTVLVGLLISEVIGLTTMHHLARRLVRYRPRIDTIWWRALLVSAVPVGLNLLLVAVVNRVDFIMLERMTSLADVGLYGAAYRVTNLLERFPILVLATLYPVMSKLALDDTARLRQVYGRAVWRFGAIALPLALVTIAAAPWLLATVFGEPYRASAPALRYLVWSTAFLYLAMTGGTLLNSVRRSRDNVIALAAGAVANVSLNAVLIPARGIEGAAMATAASYALVLLITAVAVRRYFARVSEEPRHG
jgi:O-antigen/teichoic acid export membrane protein